MGATRSEHRAWPVTVIPLQLFVTVPHPFEALLTTECQALGAHPLKTTQGGVFFDASLATAYRLCLWSRLASRILLPLHRFPCHTPQELYDGAREIDWEAHFGPQHTFAIHVSAKGSPLTQTHFAALKAKDAIADHFRERCGSRPSVDLEHPHIILQLHLERHEASLALDLSGHGLHRRGYRADGGPAPLKENLAAALLASAGWPQAYSGGLLDPLCGSGTLLIEGGWMAADIAPGLLREAFGSAFWLQHDADLWQTLLDEAHERKQAGLAHAPCLVGFDADAKAVQAAARNLQRAGLGAVCRLECQPLARLQSPEHCAIALIAANPPYGERLEATERVQPLYRLLGEKLYAHFNGSRAVIIAPDSDTGKATGWRAEKTVQFRNGPLPCQLLHMPLEPERYLPARPPRPPAAEAAPAQVDALDEGGHMLANRLAKNLRLLGKQAQREGVACYRVYDADLPEYAVAMDWYQHWAHVQEYAPPSGIDPDKAAHRLEQAILAASATLALPRERIFVKTRRPQSRYQQYGKQDNRSELHEVHEDGAVFFANFTDYLDTGVFLDHRDVRRWIRSQAHGLRFLNLYAYTATATVQAALGGARASVSVDLSNTYLQWAGKNLARNGFSGVHHRLERADCLDWLRQSQESFDLALLDPPTFSNSKSTARDLDIQRDHVTLIDAAMRRISPNGVLLFSCHHQKFSLDTPALARYHIEPWPSVPFDFQRSPRIHQSWRLRWRA